MGRKQTPFGWVCPRCKEKGKKQYGRVRDEYVCKGCYDHAEVLENNQPRHCPECGTLLRVEEKRCPICFDDLRVVPPEPEVSTEELEQIEDFSGADLPYEEIEGLTECLEELRGLNPAYNELSLKEMGRFSKSLSNLRIVITDIETAVLKTVKELRDSWVPIHFKEV